MKLADEIKNLLESKSLASTVKKYLPKIMKVGLEDDIMLLKTAHEDVMQAAEDGDVNLVKSYQKGKHSTVRITNFSMADAASHVGELADKTQFGPELIKAIEDFDLVKEAKKFLKSMKLPKQIERLRFEDSKDGFSVFVVYDKNFISKQIQIAKKKESK